MDDYCWGVADMKCSIGTFLSQDANAFWVSQILQREVSILKSEALCNVGVFTDEGLGKEASSFLRNCGWTDEVQSFMRAKKLCAREAGDDPLQRNELRRKLIADAKATLISRLPESLKTDLIKRIRAFSQEKPYTD
ncbi:hypothetical protein OSB04_005851 [Centaurea solstitialis]|uniref:Uncharacterized protein n=1 Tax=Centaurea solstitialis TaxID=347529 RepID=A0AA38WSC2_9ASTR|nr:hypothetical protein OSB04_005851 [Centaurea solstitialis]